MTAEVPGWLLVLSYVCVFAWGFGAGGLFEQWRARRGARTAGRIAAELDRERRIAETFRPLPPQGGSGTAPPQGNR